MEPSRASTGCFFYSSEHSCQAASAAPVWEPHTKRPDKTMASSKIHKRAQKKGNHEIKDNKQQRETHTQNLLVFMSHSGLPVSLINCGNPLRSILSMKATKVLFSSQPQRPGWGEPLHK